MPKSKKPSDTTTPKKAKVKKSVAQKAAPSKIVAADAGAKPEQEEATMPKAAAAATAPPVAKEAGKKMPSAAELYDEIRRRAYEFYIERGGAHGSHEADWHRAEYEIRLKYKV